MGDTKSGVPEGHQSVTPYLIVDNAADALAFYARAFEGREVMRFDDAGKIGHAEMMIGDTRIMLADAYPEMDIHGPRHFGGTPVTIHLWVSNVDAVYARAVNAGAKAVRPVADQFYGDRSGTVEDPFGHIWHISTRLEELSLDEMKRRMNAGEAGG